MTDKEDRPDDDVDSPEPVSAPAEFQMVKIRRMFVTCPCGKTLTSDDPNFVGAVHSGKTCQSMCPGCGARVTVYRPLVLELNQGANRKQRRADKRSTQVANGLIAARNAAVIDGRVK